MENYKLRNDAEILAVQWGVPIAIALVAVAVRLLFSADRMTVVGVLRGIVVGLFVGALTNLYISGMPDLTDGERGALIGLAVVLAEDLVVLLLRIGRKIRDNPESVIAAILRGRK
jgi:Na+/proline symporter